MAFRINHIHLKASDPRKTADWYVKAFAFKILSDETRVFGDRFVRCQSEDGTPVNISGARTNEQLGPATRSRTTASSTLGSTPRTSRPTSSGWKAWAPAARRADRDPGRSPHRFVRAPTTCASS